MGLYLGRNLIAMGGSEVSKYRNIGEIIPSVLPLSDAGLHLLDGSVIEGNGAYADFVSFIANLKQTNPDLFVSESTWQDTVSTYGVCGKFTYDATLNRTRLPKITGIIEGTTDLASLGTLVQAGLPAHTHTRGTMNITGYISRMVCTQSTDAIDTYGALSFQEYRVDSDGGESRRGGTINLNAANGWTGNTSDPIYAYATQNNSKVQPQTIKCFYYIVVATTIKTDVIVNLDNVATDLNLKAGTDLANLSTSGKIVGAGLGMPSNTYTDLTLGANGTQYTAPANGWFVLFGTLNTVEIYNNTGSNVYNGNANQNNSWRGCSVPVSKGDQVTVYWLAYSNDITFRFVYAVGSKSEAN